jgi:hypothetical protein
MKKAFKTEGMKEFMLFDAGKNAVVPCQHLNFSDNKVRVEI